MKYVLFVLLLSNLCLGLLLYSEEQGRRTAESVAPELPGGRLVLLSEVELPVRSKRGASQKGGGEPAGPAGDSEVAVGTDESPSESTAEGALQEALSTELAGALGAAGSGADSDDLQVATAGERAEPVALECATLGPFVDAEGARRAVRLLSATGAEVSWRSVVEQVPSGYRVFLEPLESTEKAYQVAAQLRERGVKDNFVITNPKDKVDGISLGLFTQKRGALKRLARLRNLGYQADIEMRYRDGEIQWVDYEAPQSALDEALLRELTEGYEEVQLIERYCD